MLTRFNIPLSNCRRQCYDEASNTNGHKKGVVSQILEESPLAFLTHCYDHALNSAIDDMIRAEGLLRDTIDTTSELSKLIKNFHKRDAMLSKRKEELSLETMDLECYVVPGGQREQRVSKVFLVTGVLLICCGITVLKKYCTRRDEGWNHWSAKSNALF